MFSSAPDRIPEHARPACAAVFGCDSPTSEVLSGGASGALLFRVQHRERRALLRVEGPPSPLRNPHQYAAMQAAAEVGIAPRILYCDAGQGVAITDFVGHRPLADYPGGRPALLAALVEMVRRLQTVPDFPDFVDYPDIVARLFAHVCRTGLFADGLLDAHVARLDAITATLAWDRAALVPSHNDLHPANILFDGDRLWMIDWESAYRNDPLVDVAVLLDNLARSAADEPLLLRGCLGTVPGPATRMRLAAIRALTRLYYAGVLLSASALQPRERPDDDLAVPDIARFGRDPPSRSAARIHAAGKMYLAGFLSGGAVPALESI